MSTSTAEHDSYLVENWDTETLIDFLKEQNLKLDDDDLGILRKQKVDGQVFLKLTKEELLASPYNFPGGPAIKLAEEIKALKEKPKRAFSSYKSLSEVLKDLYNMDGNSIGSIRQFTAKTYPLQDEDEELQQCIREIKLRLENMGTVLADSNEAMRCEYVSAILHASLRIVKRITKKKLTLSPQFDVVGENSTGRVDYAIKALEELVCITEGKLHQITMGFAQNLVQCKSALQVNKNTRKRKSNEAFGDDDFDYIYGIVTTATEWYFILSATDGISCTSKNPLNIRLTESVLKDGSDEEKELRKNVKRVMEVIVGLLKDRVDVEKEPAMKKQRVQGYFEKQE